MRLGRNFLNGFCKESGGMAMTEMVSVQSVAASDGVTGDNQ